MRKLFAVVAIGALFTSVPAATALAGSQWSKNGVMCCNGRSVVAGSQWSR
jgi:hypothetical protein